MRSFDTAKKLIDYLDSVLIPDLRESGSDATADDFEDCSECIRESGKILAWTSEEMLAIQTLARHGMTRIRQFGNPVSNLEEDFLEYALVVKDQVIRSMRTKEHTDDLTWHDGEWDPQP